MFKGILIGILITIVVEVTFIKVYTRRDKLKRKQSHEAKTKARNRFDIKV